MNIILICALFRLWALQGYWLTTAILAVVGFAINGLAFTLFLLGILLVFLTMFICLTNITYCLLDHSALPAGLKGLGLPLDILFTLGSLQFSAFLMLGKPPASSRFSPHTFKGPRLCGQEILVNYLNQNKRIFDGMPPKATQNKLLDIVKDLPIVDPDSFPKLGPIPFQDSDTRRTSSQVISSIHWSNYQLDRVYVSLLLEVADSISEYYSFAFARQESGASFKPVLQKSLSQLNKDHNLIILRWRDAAAKVKYTASVRDLPDCALPKIALDILMGILLSDGTINKASGVDSARPTSNNNFVLKLTAGQGEAGIYNLSPDIIVFTAALLEMLGLGNGLIIKESSSINLKHPANMPGKPGASRKDQLFVYATKSVNSMEWRLLEAMLYIGVGSAKRTKVVTPEALQLMGPMGWALAFVCDGSLSGRGASCTLHFQAFGVEGCNLVANNLKQWLGLFTNGDVSLQGVLSGIPLVAIRQDYANAFQNLILPYLPYSSYYKLTNKVIAKQKLVNTTFVKGLHRVSGKEAMWLINKRLLMLK